MYELNNIIQRRNTIIDINNLFIGLIAIGIIYITVEMSLFISLLLLVYLIIFGGYSKVIYQEKKFNNHVRTLAQRNLKSALEVVAQEANYMENYIRSKNILESNVLLNLNRSNRLEACRKYETIISDVLYNGGEWRM